MDGNFHLFFIFSTLMASLLEFSDPSVISAGLLMSSGTVQVSKLGGNPTAGNIFLFSHFRWRQSRSEISESPYISVIVM